MYQAKNDLNYISNIPEGIEYINSDFENIQTQFSISLNQLIPNILNFPFYNFFKFKKIKSLNFDVLYKSKVNIARLKNYRNFDVVNSIVNKTISVASICSNLNIKFYIYRDSNRGSL